MISRHPPCNRVETVEELQPNVVVQVLDIFVFS
jgi:hypothetical protein